MRLEIHQAGPLLIALAAIQFAACSRDGGEPAPSADSETAAGSSSAVASLPRTPAPDGAGVYFRTPAHGDTVSNPVVIEFGSEAVDIVAAGVDAPASGHHHLIIDAELPDPTMPIPANDNYIHFGDGSTRTEMTLAPGRHTLQLLLGDHLHVPHAPPIASDVITITVE